MHSIDCVDLGSFVCLFVLTMTKLMSLDNLASGPLEKNATKFTFPPISLPKYVYFFKWLSYCITFISSYLFILHFMVFGSFVYRMLLLLLFFSSPSVCCVLFFYAPAKAVRDVTKNFSKQYIWLSWILCNAIWHGRLRIR